MKRHRGTAEATKSLIGRSDALLKIGQVAAISGIGIETLRFYERAGLLDRPRRTEGGYRLYDADVLERLAFIKRAQVLGFSLDEIAHLIAERRAGRSPCTEVREIVRRRLSELDERLAQMQRYRRELSALLREWDAEGQSEGRVCGLIEGAHLPRAWEHARVIKRKK